MQFRIFCGVRQAAGSDGGQVMLTQQAKQSTLEFVWIHAIAISEPWLSERGCFGMHASYLKKAEEKGRLHTHKINEWNHILFKETKQGCCESTFIICLPLPAIVMLLQRNLVMDKGKTNVSFPFK